jgi:hypothetical protein
MLGVNRFERLVDAIRPGFMIAARHHRAASGFFHRRGNSFRIGCDNGVADSSSFGATQDVDDHRLAMQVCQWFAGKPRRCKACGD